jgi:hypothetical protein
LSLFLTGWKLFSSRFVSLLENVFLSSYESVG